MLCLDQIYQTWLPCFFLGLSQGANWLVSKTLHGTQRGENQLLHDCWRESITFVSHTHMPYVNQVPTFQFYFWAMCRGQTCGLVVNELMSYVGIPFLNLSWNPVSNQCTPWEAAGDWPCSCMRCSEFLSPGISYSPAQLLWVFGKSTRTWKFYWSFSQYPSASPVCKILWIFLKKCIFKLTEVFWLNGSLLGTNRIYIANMDRENVSLFLVIIKKTYNFKGCIYKLNFNRIFVLLAKCPSDFNALCS